MQKIKQMASKNPHDRDLRNRTEQRVTGSRLPRIFGVDRAISAKKKSCKILAHGNVCATQ